MRKMIVACAASLLCNFAGAAEIQVRQPWVRGTLDSARSTAAFMEIFSEEAATLIAASSPLARSVEMREMRFELDGGPMRPAKIKEITLPARKRLELTPVSAHLVLIDLKQPVKAGDRIPLTLKLRMQSGEERSVQIEAIGHGIGQVP
jgi:copper(I)-binding protein